MTGWEAPTPTAGLALLAWHFLAVDRPSTPAWFRPQVLDLDNRYVSFPL